MVPSTLGILGLGALGGSIARRAKLAGVPKVLGWSPEPAARGVAARQGALDDALDSPRAVAERAELVVLALPLRAGMALLESFASMRTSTLITDTAAVKRPVMAAAERLGLGDRFAGSHPLVWAEGGFEAGRTDLFCGATVYVTPAAQGDQAAREIAHFWESVCEAHTVVLDAAAHDAQVVWTEQLPHATAALLSRLLAASLPAGTTLAGAALETTRAALADASRWAEVLLENRDLLRPALAQLAGSFASLDRALEEGDVAALSQWLEAAARWRVERGRGGAP